MRTYPPYARTISRHLMRGNHPVCIGVLLGARWWFFDRVAKVCIRPDEWALGRWEFGYLKGQHVVAVWGEEVEPAQFGELLIELMLAGPRLLWAISVEGTWLYKDSFEWGLVDYADMDLTKRAHHDLALRAGHCYAAAQMRELELVGREAERAAERGRAEVAFLRQRAEAERMAELLFTDPLAMADERAA